MRHPETHLTRSVAASGAALVNGVPGGVISVHDRGLQFGDGVFETIAVQAGLPLCLEAHLQRLQQGCARLCIAVPEHALLQQEAQQLCVPVAAGVLKIIVTRGTGGRGYQPPAAISANRVLTVHERPVYPVAFYREGIRSYVCQRQLAIGSDLAGIKHLNRLEQVLLRQEVAATSCPEGVVTDPDGNVIEGSMSNLFMVKNGKLLTPDLGRAGVCGVVRGAIIKQRHVAGLAIEVKDIKLEELYEAEEVFYCNSVIGVWPVRSIGSIMFNSIDTALEIMRELTHANIIAAV
ncbi:MAG: aminodeoxychorismate lyase [Gammaproteobacteria bacterium]|nr:aminodeoxychorismate lyase [Gammaproteobacteria bacterium]